MKKPSPFIEKLFNEDIREKRKAGSGSFHKRGKGVKHGISGALRTPSYYMKTKEKNKLNGEMRSYNMYETILDFKEFQLKDTEMQKQLLTRWREIHSNKTIEKEMSINHSALNKLIHDLEIPKKPKTGGRTKRTASVSVGPETAYKEKKEVLLVEKVMDEPSIIMNGLTLNYKGVYDSKTLLKIFTKLQLVLDDENNDFIVSIHIQEKA